MRTIDLYNAKKMRSWPRLCSLHKPLPYQLSFILTPLLTFNTKLFHQRLVRVSYPLPDHTVKSIEIDYFLL